LEGYRRLGAVFVVARHEIDYLRPAFRGDVVEARTWISSVMAAKCLRATELVRQPDGHLLAKGITTWGFVELGTGGRSVLPTRCVPRSCGASRSALSARVSPSDDKRRQGILVSGREATELLHEERFREALVELRRVLEADPRTPTRTTSSALPSSRWARSSRRATPIWRA